MQVEIHVRPNAARPSVGGAHDGALVVKVAAPPEHGAATEAALRAVAEALGLSPRAVTLVRGVTSRRKRVAVDPTGPGAPATEARLARLLEGAQGAGGGQAGGRGPRSTGSPPVTS